MYHQANSSAGATNNGQNSQQQPQPPYPLPTQPQLSYGQQVNLFGQSQQQQQWMMAMAAQQNQQQQKGMGGSSGSYGSSAAACGGAVVKRQLEDNDENKENCKRPRPYVDSSVDPPMPDGLDEFKGPKDEEEADDEENEDEEEDASRSTKTGSSPEISPKNGPNGNGTAAVQGGVGGGLGAIIQQQQNNPMMAQHLYANTPQHQPPNYAMGPFPNFGMMPSTPLAHSTPMLANNAYANANTLRNLTLCWPHNMMGPGAASFPQIGGTNYGGGMAAAQQNAATAHRPFNISSGTSSGSAGHQYGGGIGGGGRQQPLQQHQLMGGYGISTPSGYTSNAVALMAHHSQQQQNSIGAMIPQITPPSFNSISSSYNIGHDSGVGGVEQHGPKNESSSGGSTEDSSFGAPNLSGDNEMAPNEPKFPPYVRQIMLNGHKQAANLEELMFGKPVPARLSLLNNNKKYQISLAEIHRRLNPPECLNTSYLSGILRRAKNKNGGNRLRLELSNFDCGLELQTGKRKSSQVTTFSTLCEREALQLAEDFGKITNDPQNGFPHHQIAMEMNRRAMLASPEQRKQRMKDVNSTMEILQEAISIVQQAMEVETQQLSTAAELVATTDRPAQQLMPQTMDQFKRFARLSHCFGNRSVVYCWETLLKVFGHYERIEGGFLPLDLGAGPSHAILGTTFVGTSKQINEQEQANKLIQMIREQTRAENSG